MAFSLFIARHRLWWLLVIIGLGVGFDQVTKQWAQRTLAEPVVVEKEIEKKGVFETITETQYYSSRVVTVIPQFFNLIYKENPAAAFSLTRSVPDWIRRPMLIGISLIATLVFLFLYFRLRAPDGCLLSALSLILAGAVGNFIDRVRLGYVIDFLDVHAGFLGFEHFHWPTFNVADSLIVLGTIGFIYRTFWPLNQESAKENPKDDSVTHETPAPHSH